MERSGSDQGWKRTGYERISLILHLFSYYCPDSDSNTNNVNHAGYDTIGYWHHKYAIWVFGYGYGIECWISWLGYGQISIPLNEFGFEYGWKISVPFSSLHAAQAPSEKLPLSLSGAERRHATSQLASMGFDWFALGAPRPIKPLSRNLQNAGAFRAMRS